MRKRRVNIHMVAKQSADRLADKRLRQALLQEEEDKKGPGIGWILFWVLLLPACLLGFALSNPGQQYIRAWQIEHSLVTNQPPP